MKVFVVFAVFFAVASAFPSSEMKPEAAMDMKMKPEAVMEMKMDEKKNDLASVDMKPEGDKAEKDAARQKRFIFLSGLVLPYYPIVSVVSPGVTVDVDTPTTVVKSAPATVVSSAPAKTVTTTHTVTSAAASPVDVRVGSGQIVSVRAPFVSVDV